MPTIEYRNKTCSYIDLAMHLKKGVIFSIFVLTIDVFKAILSHSGLLIRDKIMPHRKAKPQPNLLKRQLSSYKSYTHLSELHSNGSTPDMSSSMVASQQSTESLPALRHTASSLSLRNGTGYLSPLSVSSSYGKDSEDEKSSSSKFHNPLTRHLRDISLLARHKDGIAAESEESSVRKTKMLLGKFGGK